MKLSEEEKGKKSALAKRMFIPAAIRSAGKKGFTQTKKVLEGKPGVTSPTLLAGWLKGQAKKKGQLSPLHKYVGRKKK